MASLAVIRAQVESRLPGALSVYKRPAPEVFPTGIAALDREIGGVPQGALTQIHAPQDLSSGKTALLLSLMAQMTSCGQFCALVDASDCFDPQSAEAAGVNLARLLWVRCSANPSKPKADFHPNARKPRAPRTPRLQALEQAFKAADILVQNGGFALMAVDLGSIPEKLVRKVPLTTWFRFARVVEKMPAALVFLMTCPAAQSCAGLTLRLECAVPVFHPGAQKPRAPETPEWTGVATVSHARFLSQLKCEVEIGRARTRKPVQSAVRPRFEVTSVWAS
jgi:hypothetical protein